MSLLEQQNFLARIFTDENLRRLFWENPEKIGWENGLNEAEISQFKEIITENLNFFADSLFYKRLHEVEKLLPLTNKHLDTEFKTLFREFANSFQPKTINKHLADAINFVKFLQAKSLEKNWIKEIARFEQARLMFFGLGKTIVIKIFTHDVRKADEDIVPKRITLAFWLKFGRQTRHFIF